MKNEEYDKILNHVYYDLKNFDGSNALHLKVIKFNKNIPYDYVTEWLKKQSTHQQVTVKRVGKKEYKKIFSEDYYSYQIDLTFLPKYKSTNNQNYVMFTAININTRYAYAYYGKNKETSTILDMLTEFLNNAMIVHAITMDSGTEFTNKKVMKWFEENEITTYFVVGDSHKLGLINRFHRTLKEKLEKYFIANDTTKWIDELDTIIKNYNNTYHRSIKMTPKEASRGFMQSFNIDKAREFNYKFDDKHNNIYQIGDKCRIKIDKNIFDKSKIKYSEDIYTIIKVMKNKVNVENDKYIVEGIKNDDLIVVNDINHNVPNVERKEVIKQNKIERKLKHDDIDTSLILETKRERKPKKVFDI